MPIIDSGIYNALMQPQKSAMDYAEQYAAADDRRQQRAMNALQMQQAQQNFADDAAQRNALAKLPATAGLSDRVSALRAIPSPKAWAQADALETADLNRRETAAKVGKSEWELKKDKTDYAWRAIGAATTPEAAAQQISEGLKQGHFTMEEASRNMAELQQIGNDPAAYQRWRTGKVMALLNAHDQISATAAKPTEIRLGDRVVMVDLNPNSPTYKQQISSAKIGQSPDSVASTGLGYAKLAEDKRHNQASEAQANQAVTYQQDADGNFVALPSKVAPGSAIRATAVMAPGGVQPLPGKQPEAVRKQTAGIDSLSAAISAYRDQLGKWGALDIASPDARAAMGTAYNNMMLQAKEAYNLGVLNGPDYSILTSVVTDPSSFKGAITSKDALDKQASELDRLMSRTRAAVTGKKPQQEATQPTGAPAIGTVKGGYRFKGGNPADQSSWEKV